MTEIIFIEHSGVTHKVEADIGFSLMEVALQNNIPGIDADCGGNCACATCHVYIDGAWLARLGKAGEMEASMLDFAQNTQETSRLACQITVSPDMDRMLVRMPESQY